MKIKKWGNFDFAEYNWLIFSKYLRYFLSYLQLTYFLVETMD